MTTLSQQFIQNALGIRPSQPLPEKVDNKAWVTQHEAKLDRKDVDATFQYVKFNHPLCGVPFMEPPVFKHDDSVETLIIYADAVTVACCEALGERKEKYDKKTLRLLNAGSVSSLAYIALYHSKPEVRAKHLAILEQWRQLKKKKADKKAVKR